MKKLGIFLILILVLSALSFNTRGMEKEVFEVSKNDFLRNVTIDKILVSYDSNISQTQKTYIRFVYSSLYGEFQTEFCDRIGINREFWVFNTPIRVRPDPSDAGQVIKPIELALFDLISFEYDISIDCK